MKTLKPFEGLVGGLIEREALTTSLHIAEVFGKRHADVLRVIENISEEVRGQRKIALSYYVSSQNKKQKVYKLNRDACAFIVFGMTGKKAEEFRWAFIDAFNAMEEFITSRLQGSFWHRLMMESLEDYRESLGKVTRAHHYSNEARLINKCATGSYDRHGRDSFTSDETEVVEKLQKKNVKLILMGFSYNDRKKELLSLCESD